MRVNRRPEVVAPAVHEVGATQRFSATNEFRRLISCALLGENQFYVNGTELTAQIRALSEKLPPHMIMAETANARANLGLRHIPLFLLCCLAARKDREAFPLVEFTKTILRTPRDAMDLLALYFGGQRKPLPYFFKRAIAQKFTEWSPYQIAKYATLRNVSIRLRDVMFLTHPKPVDAEQAALFKALADDTLRAPGTWESRLSEGGENKRAIWEDMLSKRLLGPLALVRNLRNMNDVGVDPILVRRALEDARAKDIWPWQALAAAQQAPNFSDDLTALMVRSTANSPRIPGKTRVLVDVSGSMNDPLSARGTMLRMHAASGLATILREVCEDVEIGTFSNEVVWLADLPRGVRLSNAIVASQPHRGTRLADAMYAAIKRGEADRLVVITDEQSQDRFSGTDISMPVYVINVASTQRGMDFGTHVTRINGWSGGVVNWLYQEITGSIYSATEETDNE